jgi:hypothetical protein
LHYIDNKGFHTGQDKMWMIVTDTVDSLTRKDNEYYFDYFFRMMKNPLAKIIKLADLEHNLSDLNPAV